MKYLVIRKGNGGGCDHTIGCNMAYDIIDHDSTNLEEVAKSLGDRYVFTEEKAYYEENGIEVGQEELHTVKLFVVPLDQCIDVDLKKIRKDHNDKVNIVKKKKEEEWDLKELERLQKKLKIK